MTNLTKLTSEIIHGKRITDSSYLEDLLHAELPSLTACANQIRQTLCGNKIDLCSIINGRSGRCQENCKFCAQSSYNHTGIEEYSFLSSEEIVTDCKKCEMQGIDRYSIVTAGRTLTGDDLDRAILAYEQMHISCPTMHLCASHGLLDEKAFHRLHAAGVHTYHCNIETSKRYFPNICTTHSFEDKLFEIELAKKCGFEICCGGIIGMGETFEDRFDMALTVSKLSVTSIPINTLMPIPGTPLDTQTQLPPKDILRTVAMFRFINPTAFIRIAAGRGIFKTGGRELFCAGANATITGDMLTTTGNNTAQDRIMLEDMGFKLKETF